MENPKMYRVGYTSTSVEIRHIEIVSRTDKYISYYDRRQETRQKPVTERIFSASGVFNHRWFEDRTEALAFAVTKGGFIKERLTGQLAKIEEVMSRWNGMLAASTECAPPHGCAGIDEVDWAFSEL